MTTIPAALDALVGLVGRTQPDVLVSDGPWLARPDRPDVIAVGWTPTEGEAVEMVDVDAGLETSRETYDIICLASSWSGDTAMGARRARVDGMVEQVRARLVADPTLGGAVARARLATVSLGQYQTASGAEAAVEFTVRVDAFRLD